MTCCIRKSAASWVKPYQPAGIWKELANQIGENKYRQSEGDNLYRRSLYTYWKRTIPPPTMVTLDAPERSVCTVKRQVTSTPLQSLILLNDPQYVEAARVLAENLVRESDGHSGGVDSKGSKNYAVARDQTGRNSPAAANSSTRSYWNSSKGPKMQRLSSPLVIRRICRTGRRLKLQPCLL